MLVTTLWPISTWAAAVPALKAVRPDAIQLHADPDTLNSHALDVKLKLLLALGEAAPKEWWVGIAGDVGKDLPLDKLWALREKGLRSCKALGATRVVLNCEAAWKLNHPGFTAADAKYYVALAKTICGVPVWVTSFDCPPYHSTFPWKAFDSGDGWLPQIYAAPAQGQPDPNSKQGRARLALHQAKWAQATKLGWLKPRPVCAYAQGHHVVARETMWILDAHEEVCFWASSGPLLDAPGLLAARAFAKLEQLGFYGPGRVARFQAQHGLTVDGLCGPATLQALSLD